MRRGPGEALAAAGGGGRRRPRSCGASFPDQARGCSASTARAGRRPRRARASRCNPWTIPNAIGFVRLALIPVFLVVALSSDDGRDTLARRPLSRSSPGATTSTAWPRALTGQYSRLGALLDPLTDRAAGARRARSCAGTSSCCRAGRWRCWRRARLFMLVLTPGRPAQGHGPRRSTWSGRWAVWPVMFAHLPRAARRTPGWRRRSLYLGLALTLWATALYVQDGVALRAKTLKLNLTPGYTRRTAAHRERTTLHGHLP